MMLRSTLLRGLLLGWVLSRIVATPTMAESIIHSDSPPKLAGWHISPEDVFWKQPSESRLLSDAWRMSQSEPSLFASPHPGVILNDSHVHFMDSRIFWDNGSEEANYTFSIFAEDRETFYSGESVMAGRYSVFSGTIQREINYHGLPVVEYHEPGDDTISVAWIIPGRPENIRPLSFGIEASGLIDCMDAANEGEILVSRPGSDTRMRIGKAWVIDSAGRREPLVPQVKSGVATWTIDSGFLSSAQFPICLDPEIGPERSIPQISVSVNNNPQFSPKVVRAGDIFFAVWTDQQNDGTHRIWGTRIDDLGNILDPGGFLISDDSGDNVNPSIAVGFENIMVVWEEKGNPSNSTIFGMVISKESGKKELREAIRIIDLPLNQQFPAVGAIGGEFLVACQSQKSVDGKKQFDIVGRKVDSSGALIDPDPITISGEFQNQTKPQILIKESEYFLVWEDLRNGKDNQMYGLILPLGIIPEELDAIELTATGSSILNSRIIDTGEGFSAVFQMRGDLPKYGIYIQELDFVGGGFIPDPVVLIHNESDDRTNPGITKLGDQYVVVFEDKSTSTGFLRKNIMGVLLDSEFSVVSEAPFEVTNHERQQSAPAIASNDNISLIIWEDFRSGDNTDIYYRSGQVPEGVGLFILSPGDTLASNAPADQTDSVTEFGESALFLSWSEKNEELGYNLHMLRIDKESLTPENGSILNLSLESGDQIESDMLVRNGNVYVVWRSRDDANRSTIQGAIIKEDYQSGDDVNVINLVTSSGNHDSPKLASNGDQILLVFKSQTTSGTQKEIRSLYFDADLKRVSKSAQKLSESGRDVRNPQITTSESVAIVSFEEKRENNIWAQRVGWLPLQLLENQDPFFFYEPSGESDISDSRLAAGEDAAWLVWNEPVNPDDSESDALVTKSVGFRIENGNEFSDAEGYSFEPDEPVSQVPIGLTAIHDNAAVFWTSETAEGDTELFVSRLNHDGRNTMDFGKFLISGDTTVDQIHASSEGNQTLITYQSVVPPGLGSIKFRPVKLENSPRVELGDPVTGSDTEVVRLPITTKASIQDFDTIDFGAGQLEISLNDVKPSDKLEFFSEDEKVTINRNQILYDGSIVGLFSGGKMGQGDLSVILTGTVTSEILAEVLMTVHLNLEETVLNEALTTRTGSVTLTDNDGAISSPAGFTIKIESQSGPPIIKSVTPSQTLNPGEPVTIEADVAGASPLNFQWHLNGDPIDGANKATLKINNFTVDDSGDYTIEVWNNDGRVLSDPVTLDLITVDLCVRWRSEIGEVYHVVGKVSSDDEIWSSVSPAVEATKERSEFCLPLSSPFRIFEVRKGPPSTFTILDPTEPIDTTIFVEDGEVCISWPAAAGAPYKIESRRLSDQNWSQEGETRVFESVVGKICFEPEADIKLYRVLGPPIASTKPIVIPVNNFDFDRDTETVTFSWEGNTSRFYQVQFSHDLERGWRNYTKTVEETNFDFQFNATLDEFENKTTFFRILQLP